MTLNRKMSEQDYDRKAKDDTKDDVGSKEMIVNKRKAMNMAVIVNK
jgi:hypothetical protein